MTTIVLSAYDSRFFPIQVAWRSPGGVRHTNVFATERGALNYAKGRFGEVRVVNRLHEKEASGK